MAYSNRKLTNDATLFPPIQEYMTWVESVKYTYERHEDGSGTSTRTRTGEGMLRHHYTLAEAKKRLCGVGSKSSYRGEEAGIFSVDWALYHWDFDKEQWVELHAGKAGENRDDNPLFKRRLKAGENKHPIDHAIEQAAIRSILGAVRQMGARSNQLLEAP